MKRMLCLALAYLFLSAPCFAEEMKYPQPTGNLVSDFAGKMSPQERQAIEQHLRAYEKLTTVEIAVVITNLPKDVLIEQYAFGLKSAWGIGKEKLHNGVLILIAPDSLRRVWITPGSNLTGAQTDLMSGRVSDRADAFLREGKYDEGVAAAVKGVITTIANEPFEQGMKQKLMPKNEAGLSGNQILGGIMFLLIMFLLLVSVIVFLSLYLRNKKERKESEQGLKQDISEESIHLKHSANEPRRERVFSQGVIPVYAPRYLDSESHKTPVLVRSSADSLARSSDNVVDDAVVFGAGAIVGSMLSGDDSPKEESFTFGGDHEEIGAGGGSQPVSSEEKEAAAPDVAEPEPEPEPEAQPESEPEAAEETEAPDSGSNEG